jgi:glycosyltransferase involved in cell wall biosynthesis
MLTSKKNIFKVIISAYACEPYKGSEPGVGWNLVRELSNYHQLWVLTRANNKEVIERYLDDNPIPQVTFVYYDLPNWLKKFKRGNRGIHWYYYFWQIGAYRKAKKLHREVVFVISHHLTFVNYWMPSFLPMLKIPFVWGPVGGADTTPNSFVKTYSLRGKIYEYSKRLVRWVFEHDPFVRMDARRCRVAIAVTPQTEQKLKKLGAKNVVIYSQVGMSNSEIKELANINISKKALNKTITFISIGSLLHLKGFHLSIEAFAKLGENVKNCQYLLIGAGPERDRLVKLAGKLNLIDKIHFLGQMPRAQVLEKLAKCDVLIHPSLHDSGAFVCSEAMAAGLPVICLDLGGPALQVTEETGFKIPAHTPEQVIRDMAKAMQTLAENPELRCKMGEAGRKRVQEHFSWEKKGEFIDRIYREVLAGK